MRRIYGTSEERESFLSEARSRDAPGAGTLELCLRHWEGFHQVNKIARACKVAWFKKPTAYSDARNCPECVQWVANEGRGKMRVWAGELKSSMPCSRAEALVWSVGRLWRFLSTERSEKILFGYVGPYVFFIYLLDDKKPLESLIKCRSQTQVERILMQSFWGVLVGGWVVMVWSVPHIRAKPHLILSSLSTVCQNLPPSVVSGLG